MTDPRFTDKIALVNRRFSASIMETAHGNPRLRIIDGGPTFPPNGLNREHWFDLPVGDRTDTLQGLPDDLDDLYSLLKRLKVNTLFTRRAVDFDPSEVDRG